MLISVKVANNMRRDIVGFPNYTIDLNGQVYSKDLKRVLSPYSNGIGYMAIKLLQNGKRYQKYIHRLVAENFIGDCNKLDVNHIDGNKLNNSVNNLEIVTHRVNQIHAFKNKLLGGFVKKYY